MFEFDGYYFLLNIKVRDSYCLYVVGRSKHNILINLSLQWLMAPLVLNAYKYYKAVT